MKTIPEFTDAEIHDLMDFKQIVTLADAAQQRSRQIVRRIVTTVLTTGLIGGALFFYYQYAEPESTMPSPATVASIPPDVIPPATVPGDSAAKQVAPVRKEVPRKKPAQEPLTTKSEDAAAEKSAEANDVTPAPIRVDSAKSAPVFVPAEPVNGYPALYEYFSKELVYPLESIKDSIQGVTLVTFIINVQGAPQHVETDHALGEPFEREAIRVIENMPAWKPAQLDGSPVRSKVSVPITFTFKTIRKQ